MSVFRWRRLECCPCFSLAASLSALQLFFGLFFASQFLGALFLT
jgi:hypothetical protein